MYLKKTKQLSPFENILFNLIKEFKWLPLERSRVVGQVTVGAF